MQAPLLTMQSPTRMLSSMSPAQGAHLFLRVSWKKGVLAGVGKYMSKWRGSWVNGAARAGRGSGEVTEGRWRKAVSHAYREAQGLVCACARGAPHVKRPWCAFVVCEQAHDARARRSCASRLCRGCVACTSASSFSYVHACVFCMCELVHGCSCVSVCVCTHACACATACVCVCSGGKFTKKQKSNRVGGGWGAGRPRPGRAAWLRLTGWAGDAQVSRGGLCLRSDGCSPAKPRFPHL